ncbi:hypothetical protein DFH11DRAFT_1596108 [Phellopilus nigrolimitatus]|nr:hypothetical protein DFH11DRAFT_1596108 [Phellopilus nigrolimitatus]
MWLSIQIPLWKIFISNAESPTNTKSRVLVVSNPALDIDMLDYLQPPPADEHRQDIAIAVAAQLLDGKALKKTRPRRMGLWMLSREVHPGPSSNLTFSCYEFCSQSLKPPNCLLGIADTI